MPDWHRRNVLAMGAALSTAGVLASIGSTAADDGEGDEDSRSHGKRPTEVAWQYDGPHTISTTVTDDDRVYTLSDGRVYGIDAEDGSPSWETDDIGAGRSLAIDGDTLYVAADPIQAIDADTGEIQWQSEISSLEMAVGHDTVYTSSDDTVYALDADDGSIRWERESVTVETVDGEETAEELRLGDVAEDAVYVFDSSYAAGRAGMFAGLDPTTGETQVTVDHDESVTLLTAGSGHVGIFPGYDATYLYEMSTQEVVGNTSITLTHTITDETYFATGRDGSLSTWDLSDSGELAWTLEAYHSLPELVDNTVITAFGPDSASMPDEEDDEDRVMAFDLETGDELWRYVFDEREWFGPETSIVADENAVYVSRSGELWKLQAKEDRDEGADDGDDGDDTDAGDGESDDKCECPEDEDQDDERGSNDDECGSDPADEDQDESGNGDDSRDGDGDDSDDEQTGVESEEESAGTNVMDDADGSPGFTIGTGLVGGVLGLEWLRRQRQNTVEEPDE
ncbi:PQQ-binding-like beta-propeller repeat protein [Natrialbaceae archaeon A-CW3]